MLPRLMVVLLLASTLDAAPAVAQSRPAVAAVHPSTVQGKPQPRIASEPFRTADDIVKYINGYRSHPEPQRQPEVFRAMARLGLFSDTETSGMYVGFAGGMLAADAANAERSIKALFPLDPEYQSAFIKGIAYSGLPDWRAVLKRYAERMPARVALIDRFLTGRMTGFSDLKLDDGPVPVDVMWGHYFATGSFEPILRLVSVLPWATDANDVERLTVGSMVKWTLAMNASHDPELIRLLKASVGSETVANQRLLTEVIAAAETGETGRIRKDALTAIDRLKAKGPEHTRSVTWWGQAGQMALALGCVTASALGATATVGVPCVIGGAASNAALKMMTAQ